MNEDRVLSLIKVPIHLDLWHPSPVVPVCPLKVKVREATKVDSSEIVGPDAMQVDVLVERFLILCKWSDCVDLRVT